MVDYPPQPADRPSLLARRAVPRDWLRGGLAGDPADRLGGGGQLGEHDFAGDPAKAAQDDELSCGIQGGCQILGLSAGPMAARRINFARNTGYIYIAGRASVVWQASFPADGSLSGAPCDSAVLAGLHDLLSDDDVDLGPLAVVAKAEGDGVPLGTLDYTAYDTLPTTPPAVS